jgi:hypothetical protein
MIPSWLCGLELQLDTHHRSSVSPAIAVATAKANVVCPEGLRMGSLPEEQVSRGVVTGES